jgi:cold shock CspA family protein
MAETEAPQESAPIEQKEVKEKKVLFSSVTGTVKWFSLYSGYGFINRDDDSTDVFIHHSSITEKNPGNNFSSLGEGEKVRFDVVQGDKGLEAANVTGPEGGAVQGHKNAGRRLTGRARSRGRPGNRGQRDTSKQDEGKQTKETSNGEAAKKKPDVPKGEKVASGVTGKIKWFAARKGYGFISRDDNAEDVFVHHSSFAKQSANNYRPAVRENDALLFDVLKGEKGYLADNVTKPSGDAVENLKFTNRRMRRSSRGRGRRASGSVRTISEGDRGERDIKRDDKLIKDDNNSLRGRGRRGRPGMPRINRGGRVPMLPIPPRVVYNEQGYGYGYRQPRYYPGEPRFRGGRGGLGYNPPFYPNPRYYEISYGPGPMMRGGMRGRGMRGRGRGGRLPNDE